MHGASLSSMSENASANVFGSTFVEPLPTGQHAIAKAMKANKAEGQADKAESKKQIELQKPKAKPTKKADVRVRKVLWIVGNWKCSLVKFASGPKL